MQYAGQAVAQRLHDTHWTSPFARCVSTCRPRLFGE